MTPRSSIGSAVFRWTIIILLVTTFASLYLEFYIASRNRATTTRNNIESLADSLSASISKGIWEVNKEYLAIILSSVSSRSDVSSIHLLTSRANISHPDTIKTIDPSDCKNVIYRDYRNTMVRNRALGEGELWICITAQKMTAADLRSITAHALLRLATVFLVAFSILMTVRHKIIKPLTLISEKLRRDDPISSYQSALEPASEKDDELQALVKELVGRTKRLEIAQQKLTVAKRMEAVGTLTGSVAHEFNNLMAIILGNLEFLKQQLEMQKHTPAVIHNHLDDAIDTTLNAATVTRQILNLTRDKTDEKKVGCNLRDVLENVPKMTRPFITGNIKLQVQTEFDAWVRIGRSGLENSLVNLIKNATEALEGNGQITVRLRRAKFGETLNGDDPERFISIDVMDNGPGVPESIHEHLFDPFFSRKKSSRGVGLGLWIVYRFAEASGGSTLYTPLTPGSCFTLCLPLEKNLSEPTVHNENSPPAPENLSAKSLQNKKLLLIEDESSLLMMLKSYLQQHKIKVYACESVKDALQQLSKQHFDIVLCDLMLQDGLGTEVCKAASQQQPRPSILLISGNASHASLPTDLVDQVIDKPIRLAALVQLLSFELSRREGSKTVSVQA